MVQLLTSLKELPQAVRRGAVSIGNFDGVHLGHARLIHELVHSAGQVGGPAVVLTFDPPPAAILFPDRPLSAPLTSIGRRSALLGELGVDFVVAYPTDRQLLSLSADAFFRQTIVETLAARAMVEGPNFHFGRDRSGDTNALRELCDAHRISLQIVEPKADSGGMISSTRIRGLLAAGDLLAANRLLTDPLQIEGLVSEGAGRGRQLGFPTANLTQIRSLIPGMGVYAGRVQHSGQTIPAAVHIGPNPTFGEGHTKVEVHLIGWSGTLSGSSLTCSLIAKIREVQKFDSVDALKQQIFQDIQACSGIVLQAGT